MDTNEFMLHSIRKLIFEGEISALRDILIEMNVVDIATIMEELEPADRLFVFRVLPKDLSAEVFAYLESDTQVMQDKINELVDAVNELRKEKQK